MKTIDYKLNNRFSKWKPYSNVPYKIYCPSHYRWIHKHNVPFRPENVILLKWERNNGNLKNLFWQCVWHIRNAEWSEKKLTTLTLYSYKKEIWELSWVFTVPNKESLLCIFCLESKTKLCLVKITWISISFAGKPQERWNRLKNPRLTRNSI